MAWKKLNQNKDLPPFHNFQDNDTLEGTLKERHNGKFGIIYHIETKEGLVAIGGGAVIDRNLFDVKNETKLRIKYLGRAKGKMGEYKNYSVEIWDEDQVGDIPF